MNLNDNDRPGTCTDPQLASDGLTLMRYFQRITSAASRNRVIDLARALAADDTRVTPPG